MRVLGFRVLGFRVRVEGLRFRVEGSGFKVEGLGLRVLEEVIQVTYFAYQRLEGLVFFGR